MLNCMSMNFLRLLILKFPLCLLLFLSVFPSVSQGNEPMSLLLVEDFESGLEKWEPTDTKAWKIKKEEGNTVNSLWVKVSDYKPPYRSPHNISLLREIQVSDFELTLRLRSTSKPYGHQSLCLFFGYQGPSKFYYVHFGKKTDAHANQIFIVNDAPRTKISLETTDGTPWDKEWHTVRIRRNVSSGEILIFFDDMDKPVMRAVDKNFKLGQIGIGSFDDPGDFDDIVLWGIEAD